MTHHHKSRHMLATSSIGVVAMTLLPALSGISTATIIVMQRMSMADKVDSLTEAKMPDFPNTIAQLQTCRSTVNQIVDLLEQDKGPIELADFSIDIGKLGEAGLINLDSPLLATLETKGYVATYKQMLADIDQLIDDLTELSTFTSEDTDIVGKLGEIGAFAQNVYQSFWAISALSVESWMRQNTHASIIPPASADTSRLRVNA